MKELWARVETLWCQQMHPAPMWPAHGYYQCPECLRRYPVPWETPGKDSHRVTPTLSVSPALSPVPPVH